MPLEPDTFNELVQRSVAGPGMAHLVDVIQKELLHYDVLACMARSGFLGNLVFQGGTALRLCHGAPRYSEDLDFATAPGFDVEALATFNARIESRMAQRYGLPARLKAPKIRHLETQGAQVVVHRWQLVVDTAPDRPDLPSQRVKIEVAEVPAHTSEPRRLRRNYEHLPDGYENVLLPVETLREIMADKLIALPGSHAAGRTRNKDIWDLYWLSGKGVTPAPDLIAAKASDYALDDYADMIEQTLADLPALLGGEGFRATMRAFLDVQAFNETFGSPQFSSHLASVMHELLGQAKAIAFDR
ncbi:MAG: nucleotidyl transferase AbiEii/AbiGii toxin family protein [Gammaproteobacteria bacterium]|nr:nucleotidyl transferase AbiEii/AbiGii toxin family protein [Gammaproteobacteria bacterium]